jgi:SAM-dependent methyltransferase
MGEDCRGGFVKDALPYDEPTLRFYADEAPVYTASGKDGVNRHLHAFLDRLAPGARILELGCGGGRDCAAMLERGFDVLPTDGVAAMARKAEKRLGRSVHVMRFDELDSSNEYDAIWASASLLHVPRAGLPTVLSLIHRALKRGGLHYASFKAGGRDGRDRRGRYFNYLTLDETKFAYASSGEWSIISTEEYVGGGHEGASWPWVAITLQRN